MIVTIYIYVASSLASGFIVYLPSITCVLANSVDTAESVNVNTQIITKALVAIVYSLAMMVVPTFVYVL